MFTKPEMISYDKWFLLNWAICLTFDYIIYQTLGINALWSV